MYLVEVVTLYQAASPSAAHVLITNLPGNRIPNRSRRGDAGTTPCVCYLWWSSVINTHCTEQKCPPSHYHSQDVLRSLPLQIPTGKLPAASGGGKDTADYNMPAHTHTMPAHTHTMPRLCRPVPARPDRPNIKPVSGLTTWGFSMGRGSLYVQ